MKKKKLKIPRNPIAVAHGKRRGASAGFHSSLKYTRKVKHKKIYI
jgi:hypothetical protein